MKHIRERWAVALALQVVLGLILLVRPAWADCFCQGTWLNNCDICYECTGDTCWAESYCENQCPPPDSCGDAGPGCPPRECRTLPDGSVLCDP